MNIMIINHYAGSDKYGMEFRPLYMGRELVKQGHNVTVLASDCSHLRVKNPVIEKSFTEEIIEGVKYVFVKTVKYKRNDIKRLLNVMSFLKQVKSNSKNLYEKYTPDVIVASSTYPYDVKAAKEIAKFNKNIKTCYEIHDIWPLSLIEIYKLNPNNPAVKHIQRAELYAYENVDSVISILPHVNKHIEELGFDNINYTYIPNGVIIDESAHIAPPIEIVEKINELKQDDKFIVMYLGGFSKANALDDLIESSNYLDKNIHIVMVGGGPLKDEYINMLKEKNITNISIVTSVLKTQVNQTLKLADALYIGAKKTPLYKYGVGMNKIFDYMLAKRPIIYGIEASNDMIADANCGISIIPEDSKEIANAAKKLSDMSSEELNVLGANGYQYVVENHDYKKLAEKFVKALQ